MPNINDKIKHHLNVARFELYNDKPRTHLGGSEIGEECDRFLVYKFRWMFNSTFDGRMLSLFNRGHREEERAVAWLRQAGFHIHEFEPKSLWYHAESESYLYLTQSQEQEMQNDPDFNLCVNCEYLDEVSRDLHYDHATKAGVDFSPSQFRISAHNGHFGGSLDGIGYFPEGWEFEPGFEYDLSKPFLLEFKTYAQKPFGELAVQGMIQKSPKHWAQTCTYGVEYQLENVLYLPVSKNDDDIMPEFIPLNWQYGTNCIERAGNIINAVNLPERISNTPTFFKCKFCDAHPVCHKNHIPPKSCRSCWASKPTENKQWYCQQWQRIIPTDFIPQGCDSWETFQ